MPNLEGLGLQNFRTFKNKEELEFAPITLLTGVNNAGKSSVFKAIQFMVDNFKEGIVSETLDFKNMKHELGNLERIFNRLTFEAFKSSGVEKKQHMYSRLMDFHKKGNMTSSDLPIFEDDEDLVFAFPIKFGFSREIHATLEIRYELRQTINGTTKDVVISHDIKSIAIVKDGEYLHWSNIFGRIYDRDEGIYWEMSTSINLKRIIELILETPLEETIEGFVPTENTEKYSTIDLFSRIEIYKHTSFDLPFFRKKKDGYDSFTEKLVKGKSLFSDYSELTEEEKAQLLSIQQNTFTELLKGRNYYQHKVLDCFNTSFSGFEEGIEIKVANAELEKERVWHEQESAEEKGLRPFIQPMYQTTPNSELLKSLLSAIDSDFFDAAQKKIDSLKKVYFLPTSRGKNREWFIDEQNGEEIQIIKDFSTIYLEGNPQIENFVNFWIGKGEIEEVDQNGKKKQKGFKIGKKLFVFRDEDIGLTKVFLVNFDGTKTSLADLGYGISQLLPIIMQIAIIAQKQEMNHEYNLNPEDGEYHSHAFYFSPSTLLIEEPEANLHPSLQSKMAELFIDAASRFNIQFLIETHSEYLIYKFQEYIGQNIVKLSDVKMYYFNDPNDVRDGLKEKYINAVEIEKDGSIDYQKYFGEGFFDEQTNLKLSLLNIQRNHFVDDYEVIKAKLIASAQNIKNYDDQIEQLNQELINAGEGKTTLEEQLAQIKLDKENKELELQTLLQEQMDFIDEFTSKTDYLNYLADIGTIIDITKIDRTKTLHYLATGKYLLKNLDNGADFAPVVIQYGRAFEFELIKWVTDFATLITPVDKASWTADANYNIKLLGVLRTLGIVVPSSGTIVFHPGTANERKINLYHLKTFTVNPAAHKKLGELTQILELLYEISPVGGLPASYSSVPLIMEFADYLKTIFANYVAAEALFTNCRNILDMRNNAGHTYSSIISKSDAEDYVAKIEAIFKHL
ncbi:AAA family ATPase [Flavobacterium sp. UGB4466]|uniref:DUF3696 domain-containing protein n=1 Tax=Flavobacterium sp. UGB4466 TaxID=2730889 RepID=UPI00192C4505|nr:AAA family ATPase [Flavobacterium sp. UGB4466]